MNTVGSLQQDAEILLGIAKGVSRWLIDQPQWADLLWAESENRRFQKSTLYELACDMQVEHWLHILPKSMKKEMAWAYAVVLAWYIYTQAEGGINTYLYPALEGIVVDIAFQLYERETES